MVPELRALLAAQGGVVTRSQAKACGCTERSLKTLTGHRGAWVVVRRGCYAERSLWDSLDDDGRYLLRVRAAALVLRHPAAVSHASAAAVLGMPLRPFWRDLVHVTRPGVHGSRTEGSVKHHRARLDPGDLVRHGPLTVSTPARTALDIARESGFEDGVVAADAALRRGATVQQFERLLLVMRYWPGVTTARAAAEVADAGAESVGETLLRLLVLELRIGVPQAQFVVEEGGRRAAVDLRVGRHLFEFDGRVKYVDRSRGGVADRPVEEVLWEEKQREDWLRNTGGGFGMSRVVWAELVGPRRRATARRLYEEFQASRRLYGDWP